ncbi:MAG: hypothetical protein AABY22_23155 [Nanoarchaeota archaeon]
METTNKKPKVKLTGQDGNVFNLISICQLALKKAGNENEVKEMQDKIFASKSYDEAIQIMGEYCELS